MSTHKPTIGDHLWHWMYGGGYIDSFIRHGRNETFVYCEFYGFRWEGDNMREIDIQEFTMWLPYFSGYWKIECPWVNDTGLVS